MHSNRQLIVGIEHQKNPYKRGKRKDKAPRLRGYQREVRVTLTPPTNRHALQPPANTTAPDGIIKAKIANGKVKIVAEAADLDSARVVALIKHAAAHLQRV